MSLSKFPRDWNISQIYSKGRDKAFSFGLPKHSIIKYKCNIF